MKKKILMIFLTINSLQVLNGCSFFTPFKSVTACSSAKNNGAMCESVESNLLYAEQYGNNEPADNKSNYKGNKKLANKKTVENSPNTLPIIHDDTLVEKDELVRIITDLNIKNNINNEPVLIPASTYKVFIMPYNDGERFYSGRNIFITAGKSRWLMGNYVLSGSRQIRIGNLPENNHQDNSNNINEVNDNTNINNTVKDNNIVTMNTDDISESINMLNQHDTYPSTSNYNKEQLTNKYKVTVYYLNCRKDPFISDNVETVLKLNEEINVIKQNKKWWLIKANGKKCYINSKFILGNNKEQ